MLPCCLRRTLKPSATTIVISKLYQHFRVCDHPYGLQVLCLRLDHFVRHISSCNSAMDPRLDTGGWQTLTEEHYCPSSRQGRSPCKMRRALQRASAASDSDSSALLCEIILNAYSNNEWHALYSLSLPLIQHLPWKLIASVIA